MSSVVSLEPTGVPTSSSQSSSSQVVNPSSSFSAGSIAIYIFTFVGIFFALFACGGVWRIYALRRRRRLGLPDLERPSAVWRPVAEITQDPPLMYSVYLQNPPVYQDEKGRVSVDDQQASWRYSMPISTVVVEPEDEKATQDTESRRWSVLHPTRFLGHHQDHRASTSTDATVFSSTSSASSSRKVVTSVLIAMPTPSNRRLSAAPSDRDSEETDDENEKPIPEMLFGVYEGQWKP